MKNVIKNMNSFPTSGSHLHDYSGSYGGHILHINSHLNSGGQATMVVSKAMLAGVFFAGGAIFSGLTWMFTRRSDTNTGTVQSRNEARVAPSSTDSSLSEYSNKFQEYTLRLRDAIEAEKRCTNCSWDNNDEKRNLVIILAHCLVLCKKTGDDLGIASSDRNEEERMLSEIREKTALGLMNREINDIMSPGRDLNIERSNNVLPVPGADHASGEEYLGWESTNTSNRIHRISHMPR